MAHYAKVEDGVVTQVIVADSKEWCQANLGGEWIQTSYNNNFRKQYAGIGYTYDAINDVFIAPQPYPSWALDNDFNWQPPKPMPTEGIWYWNETEQAWIDANEL